MENSIDISQGYILNLRKNTSELDSSLTNQNIEKLQRLKDDLPYLARNFLKIKTKNEGIINFNFSNIQLDAHRRIEERKRQGKPCKIIFLKSRQVGMSSTCF